MRAMPIKYGGCTVYYSASELRCKGRGVNLGCVKVKALPFLAGQVIPHLWASVNSVELISIIA